MIAGSSTPLSILTLPITVGRAAVYWRSRNIAKMQTIPICAFMGVGHASTWLDSRIEKQLLRFPGRHRIAVLPLAQRDARLADLALSFPALLFALAVPRHGFEPDMVIKQVQAGASIKNMGRLTGLPWWSRRLRPEAFQDKLERLPDGEPAARQIVNHLPRSTKLAPKWLAAVSSITKWGTPDAAIWIAREMLRSSKAVNVKRLHLISLYAWYSGRPDTLGASLIRNCWRPSMSFATALRHAGDWLESLALYAQLGDQAIDDVWLSRASVDGFEFVPLCTADEIRAEALAMQNCVRTLGDGISCNCYRLWSVRCGGTRVATLSVGYRYCDPLLQIAELKGRKIRMSTETSGGLLAVGCIPIAWRKSCHLPPATVRFLLTVRLGLHFGVPIGWPCAVFLLGCPWHLRHARYGTCDSNPLQCQIPGMSASPQNGTVAR